MLDDLKLGNGTSILITANIASALPTSVGAAVQQAAARDSSSLAIYALALFATTLGVVYVQVCARLRSVCSDQDTTCLQQCLLILLACCVTRQWFPEH